MSGRRLLAVALLTAMLAGCGEKDEPAEPSSAAAIAAGDEICAEAQNEIEALRGQAPRTPEEAARLTEGVIATYEAEIADLEALAVPEALTADLDRYLGARERSLDPLRDGLEAARAGDAQAYADAQAKAAAGQVDRTRLARAVGFHDCSLPAGATPPG